MSMDRLRVWIDFLHGDRLISYTWIVRLLVRRSLDFLHVNCSINFRFKVVLIRPFADAVDGTDDFLTGEFWFDGCALVHAFVRLIFSAGLPRRFLTCALSATKRFISSGN